MHFAFHLPHLERHCGSMDKLFMRLSLFVHDDVLFVGIGIHNNYLFELLATDDVRYLIWDLLA